MNVLYVAVPVAIAMGAAAMIACVRCIRGGQFDDLTGPPVRMLLDDPPPRRPHDIARTSDRGDDD